jgi:hypothetical protein
MTRPWVRGGSDQMNVFSWACSSKNSSRKVLTDPHERNVKLSLKLASTQTPISTHSSPRCHNAHTNTSLTYMLVHRQNDLTGRYVCADFHGKFCVFSIFFARVRALSFSLARSLARYLLLSRARVLTHTQVPRRETDRSKKVISCNRFSPHVFACLRFCLPFCMSTALHDMRCLWHWMWPRLLPRQCVCGPRACACMSPACECYSFFENQIPFGILFYIQYFCF